MRRLNREEGKFVKKEVLSTWFLAPTCWETPTGLGHMQLQLSLASVQPQSIGSKGLTPGTTRRCELAHRMYGFCSRRRHTRKLSLRLQPQHREPLDLCDVGDSSCSACSHRCVESAKKDAYTLLSEWGKLSIVRLLDRKDRFRGSCVN